LLGGEVFSGNDEHLLGNISPQTNPNQCWLFMLCERTV